MRLLIIPLFVSVSACGSAGKGPGAEAQAGGGVGSSTGGVGSSTGGASASAGGGVPGGSAGTAAGAMAGGTAGATTVSGGGGSGGTPEPLPVDPCIAAETCPPNTWVNVTPEGITIPPEGLRAVVVDPKRPSDLFMGAGAAGIWKSTDYGNTWALIHAGFGYIPQGLCIAVLPSELPTILVADSCACGTVHKSTDGGATFVTTGGDVPDLYSLVVDPYDSNHLISGFHEQDGLAESTDAGETWHIIEGSGFPSGGVSWFPSFIDTGTASTTRESWIAIAQNGGSPTITHDGGATWAVPTGVTGLVHPHGNAQMFQRAATLFVPGGGGPGDGVYRSTDWGESFARVTDATSAAIVWGTPNHVYSMYSWSCFGCTIDPNFMVGSANGDTWTSPGVPEAMLMGADHVAVTSDGTRYIFVAAMRSTGIWRYVEE